MQRTKLDLNTDWELIYEDDSDIPTFNYRNGPRTQVHLPHTWNANDTFVNSRGYYRGVGWYRKMFTIPAAFKNQRLLLEFLGFFQTAEFYINEQLVFSSLDGFTGEFIDITKFARPGESNLIAVRVDNSHNPEILPGKEIPDYVLYGGIYREVFLIATDPVFIQENSINCQTVVVNQKQAQIQVNVDLKHSANQSFQGNLVLALTDPTGAPVSQAQQKVQFKQQQQYPIQMPLIENPQLWDVDHPSLYTLQVELHDESGLRDLQTVKVGLRYFEFTVEHGFFLNGRHLLLKGVNRHQDLAGLGNAIPDSLQRLDAELIKEMGGNFVRLSHYPQHPAFLDACDELGILVFAEIASWQHVGGLEFEKNAQDMMKNMIQRDRNHPAIILWGLLNEGRHKQLFERLNQQIKQLDPTRPTIYSENKPAEGDELGTTGIPDVLGLNYKIPHLDEIRQNWPTKKLFSSEHTNADMTTRGDLTAELDYLQKLNFDLNEIYTRKYLAGSTLWSMHDYATDYRPTWPHHKSGALDHLRLKKEVFYLLQSYWLTTPVLHIVGHYNFQPDSPVSITVISNCQNVELFLNNQSLGKQTGKYLFKWDLKFSPGILTAVGDFNGKWIKSELASTGQPAKVLVSSSRENLVANARDIALIDIQLLDSQDRLVWCEADCVISVQGPGQLAGLGGFPYLKIAAGRGRIPLRSTTEPGKIILSAAVSNLPGAQLSIPVNSAPSISLKPEVAIDG